MSEAESNYPKWLTLHDEDSGKKVCRKTRKTLCRHKIWCFFSDMSHLSARAVVYQAMHFDVVKSEMNSFIIKLDTLTPACF